MTRNCLARDFTYHTFKKKFLGVSSEWVVFYLVQSYMLIPFFFTCVAEGESRSRSAVTPSVCPSVRLSQNLVIATPLKLLIQLS